MIDPAESLRRTVRQMIETDRALGGDILAPGTPLPEGATAPPAPAAPEQPAPEGAGSTGPDRANINPDLPVRAISGAAADKAPQLDVIDTSEVRGCVKCALSRGRTQTVFGEGNPDADLMFVGEGPGQEEDRQGRPFVGRAGELLAKMILAMGLTRADVYIANVVKCRPPGNREPAPDEVAACWSYLHRQMKIIAPKVIVTLGNPATHRLLQTTTGITRLRGQWQRLPTTEPDLAAIRVMPTFHPAYLLRNYTTDNRTKVWSDLQAVMTELGLGRRK